MKKFNLELALEGHPLVTRGGEKVVFFFKNNSNEFFPYLYITEKGIVITVTKEGRFYFDVITDSSNDLLLEDVEWTKQPKKGDIVWVRDLGDYKWVERVFITDLGEEYMRRFIVHSNNDYSSLKTSQMWDFLRTEDPYKEVPEIEITVKINGKEAKLSDISEETLKKIKENE